MEDLQKEFVPYHFALRMKWLGFDEPCLNFYHVVGGFYASCVYVESQEDIKELCDNGKQVLAPTWQSTFRWFREKHNLDGETCRYNLTHSEAKILGLNKTEVSHIYIAIINGEDFPELDKMVYYTSKEEAELACITKLIEIVEQY